MLECVTPAASTRGLDGSAPGRVIGAVSPRVRGIGIDEDTAIVVKGQMFKGIGSGAVEADPDPDHWCHAVEMRSAEHASVHDIDAGAKTRGVLMNRCPA